MPQRAEPPGVRIVPGDGAYAGNALPEINAQNPGAVPVFRLQADGGALAAPQDLKLHIPGALFQDFANLSGIRNGTAIDGFNFIADPESSVPGVFPPEVIKGSHGYRIVPKIQSHQLTDGYQIAFRPNA